MLVLPSVDEPYPMSVLEAMSIGRAVVVTETCGLAGTIRETGSGLVVGETLAPLVDAVSALLGDPAALRDTGARAVATARERFGLEGVATSLEEQYLRASATTIER